MDGKSLQVFYEKALLPQFGIKDSRITWHSSEAVGPDEIIHYFSINSEDYALIFEDYVGLGSNEEFVKNNVKLKTRSFEYINPVSYTDFAPSYPLKFPIPYQYCRNITGSFTLIKL